MKTLILNILKYVSLPLALLYGLVIFIRNKFYDWRIFTSMNFSLPVISVGNITVGGTGKSPQLEYLIELLKPHYRLATLSRGYGRKSRGFRIAHAATRSDEIGDEPFQFKTKYPEVEVAVAEERMTAIPQLLQQRPYVQAILLDDAFQHRTVRPGLNILLTDYHRRYTKDFIMPFGLLRESRSAYKRADMIVVTKCPIELNTAQRDEIRKEINPLPHQQVFFSSIEYKPLYPMERGIDLQADSVLVVTGIANPTPLHEHLKQQFKHVYPLPFKDHHYFHFDDLEEISSAFEHIPSERKILVTTEKDASRLMLLQDKIREMNLPIWIQPIGIKLFPEDEHGFNQQVQNFVRSYYPVEEIVDDSSDLVTSTLS